MSDKGRGTGKKRVTGFMGGGGEETPREGDGEGYSWFITGEAY